jgi:UDP-N-acetylglucosamine diphosphorylase / glucose-1-phosphate thymidylyltransferase / UDP-N-acetylgalactosamine diphosphorylase / glucosamine-1-phosphate N-acetyltransferase / galactosamine-1-phosphate N-acetyltransferase
MMKNNSINSLSSLSASEECVHSTRFFDLSSISFGELFDSLYVWEALQRLKGYLARLPLGQIEVSIPEGVYLENRESISIGEGTIIEPGSTIIGPCFLGKGCVVRQGAYIRGNVLAADYVVIGHASEVKHSIFFPHSKAAHFAYVGDSILGQSVNLGAGTKCANLRFDNGEVLIRHGDRVWKTGMRKFGAIIGDGAQTGCNSVTSPGTLIKKNGTVAPCSHVKGWVE